MSATLADEAANQQNFKMRGKRSKQYRKLIKNFELTFGFREPYQVLVDAQMIQDTERFKMDLVGGLERTLHGKVKPMITQCSIRHLYTIPDLPRAHKDALVAVAKKMERRRCNHHTLDHPLSTLECFSSVIDPRNSKINKNRYVIASQEEEVRRYCRGVKGVPLVYVKRSVMVMEPMADSSVGVREGIERGKLRTGLRANGHAAGVKRKRGESSDDVGQAQDSGSHEPQEGKGLKKKTRGPKGPNPLSVKKRRISKDSLERTEEAENASENLNEKIQLEREADGSRSSMVDIGSSDEKQNSPTKRKRKRKHKKTSLKEIGDEGRHDDRDGI